MRMRRLLLAAVLALGLAPGTWVRSPVAPGAVSAPVAVRALTVPALRTGPLTLAGAWELSSDDRYFGGYSALVGHGGDTFLAASDQGRVLFLPRPDRTGPPARTGAFRRWGRVEKWRADVEGVAIDPATGGLWAALEGSNAIVGFTPDLTWRDRVKPRALRDWGNNSGPEAFARLADGRFVIIEEGSRAGARHRAVVFGSDPLAGGRGAAFALAGLEGYRPSDVTQLPDGRLLILWRGIEWGWPPVFPAALSVAPLSGIRGGAVLSSQLVARIAAPVPLDNYEGLTVTRENDGAVAIWLISDDNFVRFQRTLVLKFVWPAPQVVPADP